MEGNEVEAASVEDRIAARLDRSGLGGRAADLVLAALLGNDDLDAVLSGTTGSNDRPTQYRPTAEAPVGGLYLRSIEVQGFRGIGPKAALRLQPGPGLTVVAGRNGSGKSSLAEAAELALTDDNKRWSGRTQIWRDGWRNLHTTGESQIGVELAADGQAGVVRVTREWPMDTGLDSAESQVQPPGAPRRPLSAMNWSVPLQVFRPFLSYSELGALVSGRPSDMYDALQAILGLDRLVGAEKRLTDARKRLDEPSKQADKQLPGLRARLEGHPDSRAHAALDAVRRRPWKLDVIETLAVGGAAADDPVTNRLIQVGAIGLAPADDVAAAIDRLRGADQRVTSMSGTRAEDARRIASLLTMAVAHQTSHPGQPCPVCRGRVLDYQWAESTRAEVERLNEAAGEADAVHRDLAAATKAVRQLIGGAPAVLGQDLGSDVDATALREAWQAWASLAGSASAEELIASAQDQFSALATTLGELQRRAAAVVKQRSEAWQPVAAALASWLEVARWSERAAADLADVRKALDWLRQAGQEIRDDRMAQLTETSAKVWGMLRQESNVELGPIKLAGASTQRRVSVDVTVDGVAGAALSVMSQGELHALGLALFLPRATSPDSPFRFIIIDDPVQSMDPAKVEGLARLLAWVGEERQVVVFTHDDRLPEAIRRLQLPATIWDVARREGSVVELIRNEDPVRRYIDDARALALTTELPEDARAVVVAGFCRSALEAACHQAVRARRIEAGVRHAEVERELIAAQKLRQLLALTLLDDAGRGGEVVPALRKLGGQAAVKAFDAAREGTHERYQGDLRHFVQDAERLANALRT
jgi:energy-coupling factor transporter ATP-binding protein EcfA2